MQNVHFNIVSSLKQYELSLNNYLQPYVAINLERSTLEFKTLKCITNSHVNTALNTVKILKFTQCRQINEIVCLEPSPCIKHITDSHWLNMKILRYMLFQRTLISFDWLSERLRAGAVYVSIGRQYVSCSCNWATSLTL